MKTLLKEFTLFLIFTIGFDLSLTAQTSEIYGLSFSGGEFRAGRIFKTDGNGDNLKTVYSFFSYDGISPSSLTKSKNGKLYGLAHGGRPFDGRPEDYGVLFEWDPVTNVYTKKFEFNRFENGSYPLGALIESKNGKLYGMTSEGGKYDGGVLFEWDPVNNRFTKKLDLIGDSTGSSPSGTLLETDDGFFYGVMPQGGKFGNGVLFEWNRDNNKLIIKYDFNIQPDGRHPVGSLIQVNGKLYGMTLWGGVNNKGTIFEWNLSTNTYSKKIDFNGSNNGAKPFGSLMQASNGKIYGLTYDGGINIYQVFEGEIQGAGTLFEWNPNTNILTKKFDFSNEKGSRPVGTLTEANGKLYGMTNSGGKEIYGGVLFNWDINTEIYSIKNEFINGEEPRSSLVNVNNKLYGVTPGGGIGYGILFEFDPVANRYTQKISFNHAENGNCPVGNMVLADNGRLYGVTLLGGTYNAGVIFEWNPISNTFLKKFNFNAADKGGYPEGSLLKANNGKFYGMTNLGGAYNLGILFEWDPVTNSFAKKFDFNNTGSGNLPTGSLIQANGKIYGMTRYGGSSNNGVIFEWNPSTKIYTKIIDFNGEGNGARPYGSLFQASNGKLYGMTAAGGPGDDGVLFELNLDNNTFTKLIDFWGHPNGSFIQATDGKLYGLTVLGSTEGGGTLFEWDIQTNSDNIKVDFEWGLDENAKGSLLRAMNGKLYGSIYSFNGYPNNILFEWDPNTNVYSKKADFGREVPPGSLFEIVTNTPALTNVALHKSVTQSSTRYGGVPERAVDGNTNGNWSNGSVTHTAPEKNAWWEIDLGDIFNVSTITLWNRTDKCCITRLENYYVFTSEQPFPSKEIKATIAHSDKWFQILRNYPNPSFTFNIGHNARYIRIQSVYTTELSLAEVVVMGTSKPGETNVAFHKQVSQSSTRYGGVPERAVDGNTNGLWENGSVTHTNYDKNAWWEVDLGKIYNVNSIEVWNRTNTCCKERLSDYYAFASDQPFKSKNLDVTLNQTDIWQWHDKSYPQPTDQLGVRRPARYIRIQAAGYMELNLAEVKVFGTPVETTFKSAEFKTDSIYSEAMKALIYPVPFTDILHIESDKTIDNIEIFNMLGKTLISQKCSESSAEINTHVLLPGLYYVRIRTVDNNIKTYQVVKTN